MTEGQLHTRQQLLKLWKEGGQLTVGAADGVLCVLGGLLDVSGGICEVKGGDVEDAEQLAAAVLLFRGDGLHMSSGTM